jgi:hypothetical protein
MANETSVPQFRQLLAKTISDRIETYKDQLLELRQRELAKAEDLEKSHKPKHDKGLKQKPDKNLQSKDATKSRMAVQKIRSMTAQQVRAALNQKKHHSTKTNKSEDLNKVAPPGREEQVRALKPKVGTASAFKIAWSSYNQGRKHKVEKNGLIGDNMANEGMSTPMAMSEKDPHEHLHSWVSDFADTNHPGDKRALKAYHRVKAGTHREGDVEHFHKWINQSADKDNSGDRKALTQWHSLKSKAMGVKKADEVAGEVGRDLMSMEKDGDPRYLREEQGVPIPPKDPDSVARTTEKAEVDPGKRDAKSKSSDLLHAPGVLPCDAKSKPQDAKDTGSGTADAPKADKLGKVDVPMAKPPSGKGAAAAPSMSKPKAPAAAAAPAAPKMAAPTMAKDMLGSAVGGAMRGAAEGTAAGHHLGGATGAVAGGLFGTIKGLVEGAKAAKKPVQKAELEKAIPGTPKADAMSASFHAAQAPAAAAPAPKLPTQAEHAQRASSFAEHTPPGAFAAAPAAASTAGLKSPMSAITAALHAPKPGAPVKGAAVMPAGAGVSKPPPHLELMGKVKAALGSKPRQ